MGLDILAFFSVYLHHAAGNSVGAKNSAHAFAAPGTEQAGETIDLALADFKVIRLKAFRAGKPDCFVNRYFHIIA